jgi:hypothetical protein
MVDSLVHISNIALMEHRLPRTESDTTLWEGDELTVRFMLEEGKLNLCLRLIHDYCREINALNPPSSGEYQGFLVRTAAANDLPDAAALSQRLLTFEQGMGVLLRCCFEHVEAVQTTDLPELFQHAAEVLQLSSAQPSDTLNLERTQPAMVLRYMRSVFERIERVGEGRMMPQVQELRLVPLVIAQLHAHAAGLKPDDLFAGAHFLSLAIDTEAFEDSRAAFIDAQSTALLKEFKALFLGNITREPEQRKQLRPLLDVVTRAGG